MRVMGGGMVKALRGNVERNARIAAHRDRISKEMDRLGIRQGEALKVCIVCGEEDTRNPQYLTKLGWKHSDEDWYCPKCACYVDE